MIDIKMITHRMSILRDQFIHVHKLALASAILDYILILLPKYANDKASVDYLMSAAAEAHAIAKESCDNCN